MSNFKDNIIGCIKYDDFIEAKKWLTKARQEMQGNEYWLLTSDILEYYLSQFDFSNAEKLQRDISDQISPRVYEGLGRYYKKLQVTGEPRDQKNYLVLILDCIIQNQDFETANYWFVKARQEMKDEEYKELTANIFSNFLSQHDFSTSEMIQNVFKIPNQIYGSFVQYYKEEIKTNLRKLFEENHFTEAEQFYNKHRDVVMESEYDNMISNAKKLLQEQEKLLELQKPFVELTNKYKEDINGVVNTSGPTRLAQILKKLDSREVLEKVELMWLEKENKHRLLANYYYQLSRNLQDEIEDRAWNLAKASSHLVEAGMPEKAIEITEEFLKILPTKSKATGAVYTSRGAAYRCMGDLYEAAKSAYKAIRVSPLSYHPYNLLGGINFDEGNIDAGQGYFDKAIALGSSPRIRLMELRKISTKV